VSGYRLSVDAELDLDKIWEYIAADSNDAADRRIRKLFDAFEVLARTPGAYYIIYRADLQPIKIVAVTQGSRDIPAFLSQRVGDNDSGF
jgi:plasmid stabilization system protein ParE